jgi:hypothetical protein
MDGCRATMPGGRKRHVVATMCETYKIFLNLLLHREFNKCAFSPSSHIGAFQFSQIKMHSGVPAFANLLSVCLLICQFFGFLDSRFAIHRFSIFCLFLSQLCMSVCSSVVSFFGLLSLFLSFLSGRILMRPGIPQLQLLQRTTTAHSYLLLLYPTTKHTRQ